MQPWMLLVCYMSYAIKIIRGDIFFMIVCRSVGHGCMGVLIIYVRGACYGWGVEAVF